MGRLVVAAGGALANEFVPIVVPYAENVWNGMYFNAIRYRMYFYG